MNIILNKAIAILIVIISAAISLNAEDNVDSPDRGFVFEITGGWSRKIYSDLSDSASYSPNGFPISFRTVWQPEHLLNIGIETGLIKVSSYNRAKLETEYGLVNTKATLRAIPVLLVLGMTRWNFEISAGIGAYYVVADIESDKYGLSQSSWEWDMGFSMACSYKYRLISNLYALGLIKFYSIAEKQDYIISPQIGISYYLTY